MTVLYVGLDMAKANFSAARWQGGAGKYWGEFSNDQRGYGRLCRVIERHQRSTGAEQVHVTLEPTGGYERRLVEYAHERGWKVSLPNPKQVRDWAKGLGQRAKTDKQDALVLAHYGADRKPPVQGRMRADIEDLDSLLRRQEDLEKLLQQERNRLEALGQQPRVPRAVRESVRRMIESLEEALEEIKEALAEFFATQPELQAEMQLLRSVPGVGPRIAPCLLVFVHRWKAITKGCGDAKGLTAYAGLDPRPSESGQSVRRAASISKMGATAMRTMLYMGALGGKRGNSPLRDFYNHLVERGKAKKVALIAAARKILVWAWAVFCSRTPFDPSRVVSMPT